MKTAHSRSLLARLLAIASLLLIACALSGAASAQTFGGGLMEATSVAFSNRSPRTLYVAFSIPSGNPGPVVWSDGCLRYNNQVAIEAGQTCMASVPNSVGASRFCASENPEPVGKTPNCYAAQRHNLTMIETNFTSGNGCVVNPCLSAAGCAPPTRMTCVWYDISVIPLNCTNCEWAANNCNDAGGPSYNVPVQLSCNGSTTFVCRGPIGPIGNFGARYPVNCGTPFNQPTCVGNQSAACLQAYFFPMSTSGACKYPSNRPLPTAQCPQGQTLVVTFLEGQ